MLIRPAPHRFIPTALLASLALTLSAVGSPAAADHHADAADAPYADPASDAMTAEAPAVFDAVFDTTAGPFTVRVHREWAPAGADRFFNLVDSGFYNDQYFFRVVPNFVVQWGMHGEPAITQTWQEPAARIADDPVTQTNRRGTITFATSGPDSRTTQVFINFKDNARLDGMGFAPFGEIIAGMENVDAINAAHGQNPQQQLIAERGNAYLGPAFPGLDQIRSATVQPVDDASAE